MVLSAPQLQNLTLHVLLEKTEDGRSRATLLELPDCVVEAPTDEEATEQLQQLATERLTQKKIIPMNIPLAQPRSRRNSWIKYAGVFKDDPDFAEIAESLRAERRAEEDESAE
jgi:hypothetical protein